MIPRSNADAEYCKEVVQWWNRPWEVFEVCKDVADDEELRDDDCDDGSWECRLHGDRRGAYEYVVFSP